MTMKTLQDHTLIYDKDCPLCVGYTSAFINTGMLDKEGRHPYSQTSSDQFGSLDMERAKDEIALVNRGTGTVTYGIDSLLKVLGNAFPPIERMGNWRPIHLLSQKIYSFISFNRKVIILNAANKGQKSCDPSYNFTYRLLFIILSVAISIIGFGNLLKIVGYETPTISMVAFFIGIMVLQLSFLTKKSLKTIVHYTGNMMTIFLIGSILALAYTSLHHLSGFVVRTHKTMVFIIILAMFVEHARRVNLLDLSPSLTISWLFYTTFFLPEHII